MKIVMGILLLLFLGGCGSEKSEAEAEAGVMVEGQVFVVTKSRENIKMGLVPIHVVPFTDYIETFTINRTWTPNG